MRAFNFILSSLSELLHKNYIYASVIVFFIIPPAIVPTFVQKNYSGSMTFNTLLQVGGKWISPRLSYFSSRFSSLLRTLICDSQLSPLQIQLSNCRNRKISYSLHIREYVNLSSKNVLYTGAFIYFEYNWNKKFILWD